MNVLDRFRKPRDECKAHLRNVSRLPCLLTQRYGVQVAHLRYTDGRYGKRHVGLGEKPDDRWVVPLCPALHMMNTGSQHHDGNEQLWWSEMGVDAIRVAHLLWEYRDKPEIMADVVYAFRPTDQYAIARIARILRGAA